MKKMLENSKNLTFADTTVKILSALNEDSHAQIEALAEEKCGNKWTFVKGSILNLLLHAFAELVSLFLRLGNHFRIDATRIDRSEVLNHGKCSIIYQGRNELLIQDEAIHEVSETTAYVGANDGQ